MPIRNEDGILMDSLEESLAKIKKDIMTGTQQSPVSDINANGLETNIPTDQILSDNEFNCRGNAITAGSVIELAEDIKQLGLLQRIIIQPWEDEFNSKIKFRIVAGHRRYAAMKLLKWQTVPSKILNGLNAEDAEVINISENLKRKDLNILQEARALDRMAARGASVETISKKLDVGRKWVKDRLLLMQLPSDVQQEAAAGIIKATHIEELIRLKKISVDKMYANVHTIKNQHGRRKITVKERKPVGPSNNETTVKRVLRPVSEIFKIQELMLNAIGTNLASQALAWAVGEIGVITLLDAIKYEADLLQIPWSIPQHIYDEEREREKAKKVYVELVSEPDDGKVGDRDTVDV